MSVNNEKILNWLAWRQASKSLHEDAEKMENAQLLKLGNGYAHVLRGLAGQAAEYERTALSDIRKAGITILGAKEDRGECFVWWRQRGQSDMFRVPVKQLQGNAQTKLEELLSERKNGPSPR